MKLIYWFRDLISFIFSKDYIQCDLCRRNTHLENLIYYYDDVISCSICTPKDFIDEKANKLNEVKHGKV